MSKPVLFLPITKVDQAKRLVYGVATVEEVDKTNEIFDYDTSKPYIDAWSKDFMEKTDGQSCGNLRAMHKAISAGKLVELNFHDDIKTVTVCAKVVDDDEWKKVDEGVYTGFSFGGKSMKKWADATTGAIRYTLMPTELSLADSPCVKSAVFYDVVKVDGTIEQRQFKVTEGGGETVKKSNVLKIAIGNDIQKGLYSVRQLADLLQSLSWLQSDTAYEAQSEGDNSPLPAKLKELASNMAEILKEMVDEETTELITTMKNEPTGDIQKAGARNSKTDLEKIQTMHDHACELGAKCEGVEKAMAVNQDDINKISGLNDVQKTELMSLINQQLEPITKVAGALDVIQKALPAIEERLKAVEGTPLPAKTVGTSVSVSKADDTGTPAAEGNAIAKADGLLDQIQKANPELGCY